MCGSWIAETAAIRKIGAQGVRYGYGESSLYCGSSASEHNLLRLSATSFVKDLGRASIKAPVQNLITRNSLGIGRAIGMPNLIYADGAAIAPARWHVPLGRRCNVRMAHSASAYRQWSWMQL